jgi:hypothetical protein
VQLTTYGGGNDIRIDDQFPGSTFVGRHDRQEQLPVDQQIAPHAQPRQHVL